MGAALCTLLISTTLGFSPTPHAGWRALAAVLTVTLAWPPVSTVLFQRGPRAVRRFEWAADGRWFLIDMFGARRQAWLSASSASLGPWILLVWSTGAPRFGLERIVGPLRDVARRQHSRTRYALIDVAAVGRPGFRALKGRLRLTLEPAIHTRRPDDNC